MSDHTLSPLVDLLLSSDPDATAGEAMQLFGQFVGRWTLEWTGFTPSGDLEHAVGELAFDWVLGGRAVQDVWIVPGRGRPGVGLPPRGFYGTTVRFYDPRITAWRSTWINPVTGGVRRFIGRPASGGIELLSDEQEPWLRWRFVEITTLSFRWEGSLSDDHGTTWDRDEVMMATRVR